MKKRVLFLALILLFILGGTIGAFAWWDILSDSAENQAIELGYGVRLELDNQSTEGEKLLVPSGSFYAADTDNYTTSIVFTYDLSLEEGITEDLDLLVDIADLMVGLLSYVKETTHSALIVTVNTTAGVFVGTESDTYTLTQENTSLRINQVINSATPVIITVTFTLITEGGNQETYSAVAGEEISFDIAFEIPVWEQQSARP